MNGRQRHLLLCLMGAGCLIVVTLVLYAKWHSPFDHHFSRLIKEGVLTSPANYELPRQPLYIAGSRMEVVYLVSKTAPLKAWTLDLRDGAIKPLQWSLDAAQFTSPRVAVTDDTALVFDYAGNSVCLGSLETERFTCLASQSSYIQQAAYTGQNTIVCQSLVEEVSSQENINMIGLLDTTNGEPSWAPNLLVGDKDRYFTTKGILRYCELLNVLVYTYTYRGSFVVFNSSLQQLRTGVTIDGNIESKIRPIKLSENRIALASPDWVVNENATVYHNWLLVQSNIRAANETQEAFTTNAVIDLYDIQSGLYRCSFYLPLPEGELLNDFHVTGNRLTALYDTRITVYEFMMRNAF